MFGIVLGELPSNRFKPLLKDRAWSCVEGRKRTYDTGLALSDHQVRVGNDEKRCANDWQSQATGD